LSDILCTSAEADGNIGESFFESEVNVVPIFFCDGRLIDVNAREIDVSLGCHSKFILRFEQEIIGSFFTDYRIK
jgi:hypothetical protein